MFRFSFLHVSLYFVQVKIKDELDKLCGHLPNSLIDQCTDFVKEYSKELVEMLLADLTPKEICVYIKLCNSEEDPGPRNFFLTDKDGEISKSIK